MPRPRRLRSVAGVCRFRADSQIILAGGNSVSLENVARFLRKTLSSKTGLKWPICRNRSRQDDGSANVTLLLAAGKHGDQAYSLRVRDNGVLVRASAEAGLRYGVLTLTQLLDCDRPRSPAIRAIDIEDWPDFEARGVMLDISRDKVPTLSTLKQLVDRLAGWKINQLQLYTEHTFAYAGHEQVWHGASPLTGPQIDRLDQYCRDRGVELVPNQNSFGHMERWLKHAPYRCLAETTGRWQTPWGDSRHEPTTLNPLDPGSIPLVASLYKQLLPHFSSKLFNVGCDETFELGQGRSKTACRRRGVGRVYLSFLKKIHRLVRGHGRRMMFWSDVIQQHPELIDELPRDAIPMIWGYEAGHPFEKECSRVVETGLDFYVCPGTSSWCSFSGRARNCVTNLREAARSGLRHGATGFLITDWGDYGHRQYLPVSYLGYLYGAAVSWCGKTNATLDAPSELGRTVFGDATGKAGKLWHDAGDVHEIGGAKLRNRTRLFSCMESSLDDTACLRGVTPLRLHRVEKRVETLLSHADKAAFQGSEGSLAREELVATLGVLRHACRRASLMLVDESRRTRQQVRWLAEDMKQIILRHRVLWLRRNRRGGLVTSLGYYRRNLREYQRLLD